jgi:hypothetical protein
MMRLRRASVIATLSLLAWAVTAHAECAWILWHEPLPSALQRVWSIAPVDAGRHGSALMVGLILSEPNSPV